MYVILKGLGVCVVGQPFSTRCPFIPRILSACSHRQRFTRARNISLLRNMLTNWPQFELILAGPRKPSLWVDGAVWIHAESYLLSVFKPWYWCVGHSPFHKKCYIGINGPLWESWWLTNDPNWCGSVGTSESLWPSLELASADKPDMTSVDIPARPSCR